MRRDPGKSKEIWDGYLDMVQHRQVITLIDEKRYSGIASIPKALQDLHDGRLNGKAVIDLGVNERAKI